MLCASMPIEPPPTDRIFRLTGPRVGAARIRTDNARFRQRRRFRFDVTGIDDRHQAAVAAPPAAAADGHRQIDWRSVIETGRSGNRKSAVAATASNTLRGDAM